jgi:hypothetical protein
MSITALKLLQRSVLATVLLTAVAACSTSAPVQAVPSRDSATIIGPIPSQTDANIGNRDRGN